MKQNKFDLVMDYIDENIHKDSDTIKKGIIDVVGINSNRFGEYFNVLTNDTLGNYIRNRRLYFAAKELQGNPQKTICDVALDFGYSDQSSFTRAFTAKYDCSPSDLRLKNVYIFLENNKYRYTDYDNKSLDSRSSCILRKLERKGFLSGSDIDYLKNIEDGQEQYGFDIDTCYAIADLSERLEISMSALMSACFNLVEENKAIPFHLTKDDIAAIDFGIHSYEDVQKICEYYSCSYYELDTFMVDAYYDSHP